MNKRWMTALLGLMMAVALLHLAPAQAGGFSFEEERASVAAYESLPPNIQYYTMKWPFSVGQLTPLSDGSILLTGWITYPGLTRDLPDHIGYERAEDAQNYDAFAVCLGENGEEKWQMRLGDPQASNSFWCKGRMPDGRLLINLTANDGGEFGSQHFIVSQDGIVEEMLPAKQLAGHFAPRSLQLGQTGYYGGMYAPMDDIWGDDFPRVLKKLDYSLNELWRYDGLKNPDGFDCEVIEGVDGSTFVTGSWQPLETYQSGTGGHVVSVVKLSADGKVLWEFKDESNDGGFLSFGAALPREDGGILLAGNFAPESQLAAMPEGEPLPTLTALSKDGQHQWTRVYKDIAYIGSVAPFGDGLLLSCSTSSYNMAQRHALLYVSMEDGEPLSGVLPVHGGKAVEGSTHGLAEWSMGNLPGLAPSPDGEMYVFGMMNDPMDWEERRDGDPRGFFYAKISVDDLDDFSGQVSN